MISFCLIYVLNATCISSTSLTVPLNLKDVIWSGDDRKECMSIVLLFLHTVDI